MGFKPRGATLPIGFSRETDIFLDKDGVFWHEGTRISHARLRDALASWIDIDPASGRYILKNAVQWCFFQVEDTPFVVRGVRRQDAGWMLLLSDGDEEPLAPDTLRLAESGVLYCEVKSGRFPARFRSEAAVALLADARVDGDDIILPMADGYLRLQPEPR